MSLAISEEQLARRLVGNRRLAQTVDQAGAVMNRAAFATPDVLNMALDVLGVPNDDRRPTLLGDPLHRYAPDDRIVPGVYSRRERLRAGRISRD